MFRRLIIFQERPAPRVQAAGRAQRLGPAFLPSAFKWCRQVVAAAWAQSSCLDVSPSVSKVRIAELPKPALGLAGEVIRGRSPSINPLGEGRSGAPSGGKPHEMRTAGIVKNRQAMCWRKKKKKRPIASGGCLNNLSPKLDQIESGCLGNHQNKIW